MKKTFFNSERPVWRNREGKIACPGDSCPKECDDTCPIYLNTIAMYLVNIGQDEKAMELYLKMIDMAPDMYDAWNNLAAAYGSHGEFQKAHDCYLKAHELNPAKPNPVYGLMLTSRDLALYEEAVEWCDEFDSMGTGRSTISIRQQISQKMGQTAPISRKKPKGKF